MNNILVALLLLCAVSTQAQFSDNFSNGGENTNWKKYPDELIMKYENGACLITNNDTVYASFAAHSIENSPTTFTLSGKVTLSDPTTQSAGFICCLAATGMATGYYVSIVRNELVTVDKIGSSGVGSNLVAQRSPYMVNGTNELTISKKEETFNLFCNGHFVATFTDGDFASGNIAMQVATKTSATFDDIVMTTSFTEGAAPTCFSDNFDDGDLLGWSSFGSAGADVSVKNKAMYIVTEKGENTYQVIDLPLDSFVLRASFSHRGGSVSNLYGLFISGVAESNVPITGFGISGNKSYAVFGAGQTITLKPSTVVKGAAYIASPDTTWYTDTLEVIKRPASAEYLFVINGDTLSRYTDVTFNVTGAGIFSMDSMTIKVDDFIVAQGEKFECPVRHVTKAWPSQRVKLRTSPVTREFDLLGRSVMKNSAYSNNRRQGVTIIRNGEKTMMKVKVR